MRLKKPRGPQYVAVGQPWEDARPDRALGCCSSPRHLCGRWGAFLGMLCGAGMHLLYLCETFCIYRIFVKPSAFTVPL